MRLRAIIALFFAGALLLVFNPLRSDARSMPEVGISNQTQRYIENSNFSRQILNDARFNNALRGLAKTETAPGNATVIRNQQELRNMRSGNTYVVRGNITVGSNIKVPGNVTVYVEGSIRKNGSFGGGGENKNDAIFDIKNVNNVRFYGVNNATIASNGKSVAFVIKEASNVVIDGFRIENTWEAVSAQWNADRVTVTNNHIIKTQRRAVWLLGADDAIVVHNFMEDIGWDGIDWDFRADDNVAFENVVISAGRWCGFVEEAAMRNQSVRNVCIMAEFRKMGMYPMGWADNGTQPVAVRESGGKLTKDNYFIDNVVYKPNAFRNGGGDYFAKGQKGITYFWGNDAFGAGKGQMVKAEWTDSIPAKGQRIINDLDKAHNSGGNPNPPTTSTTRPTISVPPTTTPTPTTTPSNPPTTNPRPGDECRATGPDRAAAQRAFAETCRGLRVVDCDPAGNGWICSNKWIPNNPGPNTTTTRPTTPTTVDQSGECRATGPNLGAARRAFSNDCAGKKRVDCDPVRGGWVCSTRRM